MPKENYQAIVDAVNSLDKDIEKFYDKGTDSAGTRIRKVLRDIEQIIKAEKSAILSVRNERKES